MAASNSRRCKFRSPRSLTSPDLQARRSLVESRKRRISRFIHFPGDACQVLFKSRRRTCEIRADGAFAPRVSNSPRENETNLERIW
jgi:hypothetical protein